MKKFDKKHAEEHVNKLLKKHKITVKGYSTTACGRAHKKERWVKIPRPTNIDRFAVCLHEIFHIIGKNTGARFKREFECDMYARQTLIDLGYDHAEWDRRLRWHVLSRIAMAHNRKLNHEKIGQDIRTFFSDIDFSKWEGKKVFVGHAFYKSSNPDDIRIYQDYKVGRH
jgi:hypothetical protein